MIDLSGKTAIVTGGTRGIGRAITLTLHKMGVNVSALYLSNKEEADKTYQMRSQDKTYLFCNRVNVAERNFVRSFLREHSAALDIVINCAGVNYPSDFEDIKDHQTVEIFRTNLMGPLIVCHETLPYMKRGGSIINIGSLSAFVGGPRSTHYAVSKAGLVALTQNLAINLAPDIRCNLVAPGYIDTGDGGMAAKGSEDKNVQRLIDSIPMGRKGLPEEVANVVAFLASDLSSYITGQVIHVNGGVYF